MSKKSKAANSLKRRAEKRRLKAAQQAKYESFKNAGTNSKSKRFTLNSRRGKMSQTKHLHLTADCGNPGCKQCFPRQNVLHAEIRARVLVWARAKLVRTM